MRFILLYPVYSDINRGQCGCTDINDFGVTEHINICKFVVGQYRGVNIFPALEESPQNSRRQPVGMKQVLGATVQNVVATETWSPGFVHPWISKSSVSELLCPRTECH